MQSETLQRKQIYMSASNVRKIKTISEIENISAAEVVRKAIDCYSPDDLQMDQVTIDTLNQSLLDSIAMTDKAIAQANKILNSIGD